MLHSPLALLLCLSAHADQAGIERLELAVRRHVAQRLELDTDDVEILHLGVASLPPCADDAKVVLESHPSERFHGHANVSVDLYAQDETCASMSLRPRVRTWSELPVAASDLEPGQEVRWELRRVTMDRIAGTPVQPERLSDTRWLTRTTIAQGEPLTELVLRARPDGSSGDQVQVLAGTGGLLIETPGRLMADAFLGDKVRVANLATRGVHEGTLFAPGCVSTGAVTPRMKEACPHVHSP